MQRVQLVAIRPPGTPFGLAWTEGLEALQHGLSTLGIEVTVNVNHIDAGITPIIFGSHHLPPAWLTGLPADTILYNFEQLLPGYYWFQPAYLDLLRRFQVWDYASPNVRWLRDSGTAPTAEHVPPGYVPQWTRVPRAVEDVDVLFYGLISPRRRAVLEALQARGIKLQVLQGVFGEARDLWIARAKLVLNLRLEDSGHFESLRVNYLLANRKAVVTEVPAADDWDADLLGGVRSAPYAELVEACLSLLADDAARDALAEAGFGRIRGSAQQMTTRLRNVPGIGRGKMSAA